MVRSRSCGFPARAPGRCTTVSGPLFVHWISRSPQSDMMARCVRHSFRYDRCRRCCGEVEFHATKTSGADRRCAISVDVCLRHAWARASQSCCVLLLSTRGGDVDFQWYNPFFTCSASCELGHIDSERDEASILVAPSPQLAVRDVFTPLIQLQVPCWGDSRQLSVGSGLEFRVGSGAQLLCRQAHKPFERVSSSGRECRNVCIAAPVGI